MDFTLKTYKRLLEAFKKAGYTFLTLEKFVQDFSNNQEQDQRVLILRHDVDRIPGNSLETARIEQELNIYASYYFRIVKESFNINIIKSIIDLNHEIGYHYEDLAMANGNYEEAYRKFEINLNKFRDLYPVKTICMHGNPMSKWDNRLIWKKYSYKNHGIISEPYFDLDYNRILYLTDTGRRWNAARSSIRDKVRSVFNFNLKSTNDIILALERKILPNKIMINSHPERWTDSTLPWVKQLVWQNIKNLVKKTILKAKGK